VSDKNLIYLHLKVTHNNYRFTIRGNCHF